MARLIAVLLGLLVLTSGPPTPEQSATQTICFEVKPIVLTMSGPPVVAGS